MFPDFSTFFRGLWGREPFPWQAMLAERAVNGFYTDGFPDAVDLPTASGKTACLDIGVYALAAQAAAPLGRRTAARRIWFVVDRRIVVDEAYERAQMLAKKLEDPSDPALRAVAERLLKLRGLPSTKRPLAVGRLRGGVLRDDGWARIPSQAAIITSTVDQLGSRLLFRGYGHRALAAPIFAGLVGNDSLILLDEAHCAVPFLQTLRAVKMFRAAKWSEEPNLTPFHVAVLSATPPSENGEGKPVVFPANEEEGTQALNDDVLQTRLTASKPAVLVTAKDEEKLTSKLAEAAESLARSGTLRVGVIVNRVGRAAEIAETLRREARGNIPHGEPPAFDVELLTGRVRSVERDALVGEKLHPLLHSSPQQNPFRPLILVSTQCLEVGADFSFDALVTECASLDALRQRFGRLARLGKPNPSQAFIVAAESALKERDPIYGDALKATWEFLWNKATVEADGKGKETHRVDFGFEALRALLPPPAELRPLLAPAPDAPILLPAHLDLLCETSPLPHPDPDIGIFLHGKGRKAAESRVAFRCDFDPEQPEHWAEIASLCRPVSGEMFSVPLHRLRAWLQNGLDDKTGDVEGESEASEDNHSHCGRTKFLIFRGRDGSTLSDDPDAIYPNTTILLPAPRSGEELMIMKRLGQVCESGLGKEKADLWELALIKSGKPAALRLHRECLAPWLGENGCPPLCELMELIDNDLPLAEELRYALAAVRKWDPRDGASLPDWLRDLFERTKDFCFTDIAQHPGGGIILRARKTDKPSDDTDYFVEDDFGDDTDAASEAPDVVSLPTHSAKVAAASEKLALACLGEEAAALFKLAGDWHDAGKLDLRFQEVLRGGAPDDGSPPLAKSPDKPRAKGQAKQIATAAGLPEHFRHELLSVQLVERFCKTELSDSDRALLLHLIASHHGHGRPFAPVCEDTSPPAVEAIHAGVPVELSAEDRAKMPAHRLDSGITDRFWQLTRRFGWWGLAYREAILRLADWYASEHPAAPSKDSAQP